MATSDEWIVQRTGIKERYYCGDDEGTTSLCVRAAADALAKSKFSATEIDLIICATSTADQGMPSTACFVQKQIGAERAFAFDVNAACSGFVYAMSIASSMIESRHVQTAIVVGGDSMSRFLDWEDRGTCVLFGDGAGAIVLQATTEGDRGVLRSIMHSDGSGAQHITIDSKEAGLPAKFAMNGSDVFRFAVSAVEDVIREAAGSLEISLDDVDLVVPHQANIRIIETASKKLGIPLEKFVVNLESVGNTCAASIPLALYEAARNGRLKPGMLVLFVGFGAGLTWGVNAVRI